MNNFRRGFTLVELLIVFAVIGVLTGLTLASYRTSAETRNLEGETRRLVDSLNLAYKKGYSAETGPLAQCADFRGFRLSLNPGAKQYSVARCCNATCSGAQSVVISTYTIPHQAVSLTAPAAVTTYLFQPLSAQTNVVPAGATTITLRNSAIRKCITLDVGSAGAIQENAKIDC